MPEWFKNMIGMASDVASSLNHHLGSIIHRFYGDSNAEYDFVFAKYVSGIIFIFMLIFCNLLIINLTDIFRGRTSTWIIKNNFLSVLMFSMMFFSPSLVY